MEMARRCFVVGSVQQADSKREGRESEGSSIGLNQDSIRMKVSSFDIFDTCLLRKCGMPENFFDVFSLRVFYGEVEEWARQEFVAARYEAQRSVQSPSMTLQDIWNAFSWTHPQLKPKEELCLLEQETEREMLVPVLKMREKVNECRAKGHHIIFISDMYLSSNFLVGVMTEHGFMQDCDSLYVSCECGAEKRDGGLFKYIKEKEGLSYRSWRHIGDNKLGDYKTPRKLGIRASLINLEYTPYQKQWIDNDYSLGFQYTSIVAGLSRALRYSIEWTTHTDFVLDLIAPFYCSLVYRMMRDAEQKGIKRLYFCARDTYMMYKIASLYQPLFPTIENRFLYISRKSLYEGEEQAKIAYFQSVGLATKEDYVGIVDIRSSGRTLVFLNDYFRERGFRTVRGYYFELFCSAADIQQVFYPFDYYAELSDRYDVAKAVKIGTVSQLFETFFSLNYLPKTINYSNASGKAEPVFSTVEEDEALEIDKVYIHDREYWANNHENLIILFANSYIKCGLNHYSDELFDLSQKTVFGFITSPNKIYLEALRCLYGKRGGTSYLPFIREESWIRLLFTRGKDSLWKQGTIGFNDFQWFQKIYKSLRNL